MKLGIFSRVSVCLLVCALLGACQTINDWRKVDYKNTRTLPPLEVPPDLSTVPDTSQVPNTATARTAAPEAAADRKNPDAPAANVLPLAPNARIERDRQTRWLVVQSSAENLWPQLRQFVADVGLKIERDTPATGVIETEWTDSRAQGTATATALRRLGWHYPLAARYKFRIRLERGTTPGTTEVYVSAFGLEQTASADVSSTNPGWRPRAPDADVEAEMLRLLLAYLGKTDVQARTIVAQAPAPATERAQLVRREGSVALQLEDSLDRAWRRVGLSLDRVGFTVEDRDRSKGVYYVRYLDPDKSTTEPGWFARMFGIDDTERPEDHYQIYLQNSGAGSSVVVRNHEGVPEAGKTGERILTLLLEQLK